MADDASDTIGGGLKNWLGTLAFVSALLGGEEVLRWLLTGQGWPRVGLALIVLALPIYWSPWAWKAIRRRIKPGNVAGLKYLRNTDSELGSAIRDMVWRSAWARWYAAQLLVNSGQPAAEENVLHVAALNVMDNLIDGDLEVRGRMPGSMEYQAIPRTHWRSSALYFIADSRTIWKMIIIPKGGAEFAPDGTMIASDQESEQRSAVIRGYDSLIVDAYQFEKLWPKREHVADKKRRQLLREALRRGLDKNEIQRLSGLKAKWQLQLLRFRFAGLFVRELRQ